MDIAALSIGMQQANLHQQVDLSLMKKVMETAETNGQAMANMLQQMAVPAPHPTLGNRIDVKG